MVELTQNQIVDLFVEKMEKYSTKYNQGTFC